MSDYLQRLVMPRAEDALQPVLGSTSPVAEIDQRFHVDALADLVSPPEETPGQPVAPVDRAPAARAAEPARVQPAVAVQRTPQPSTPVVQRFMATPAGQAVTPSLPAAPPAMPSVPAPAPSRVLMPELAAAAGAAPERMSDEPIVRFAPETRQDRAPPARWSRLAETREIQPPVPAPPSMVGEVEPHDLELAAPVTQDTTVLSPLEAFPLSPSIEEGDARIPVAGALRPGQPATPVEEPWRRPSPEPFETDSTPAEPVRTPGPARNTIVVRQRVPSQMAPPPAPAARERRGPTSAAEASVIGPLDRHDRSRVHLDLGLR